MGLELESRKAVNIVELALLRLLHERVPHKTPKHTQALLYIINSGFYRSTEDISRAIGIQNGKLQCLLDSLSKKELVQKTGCLYKPKGIDELWQLL